MERQPGAGDRRLGILGGALESAALAAQGAQVRGLVREPSRGGYIAGQPNIELAQGRSGGRRSLRRAVEAARSFFTSRRRLGGSPDKQHAINVEDARLAQIAAEAGGSLASQRQQRRGSAASGICRSARPRRPPQPR
ncbi:MAG: hypothetical protein IPK52_19905 [Chloroflexi bacterium]|nr:hypothetical protein [Chloroflexota bacterium]